MGYIYVYDAKGDDVSTTGLVGALVPTEVVQKEIACDESSVTLTHPFDPAGKWRALKEGNLLSVPCRVRTTPEIDGGQYITSVEEWSVKATATKAQRGVFSKSKKGTRKATLNPGTSVIVTQKGEERYKIKTAKVTGWIAHEALDFVISETLPPGVDGIETVLPSVSVRPQIFVIKQVERDTDAGTITVYALHSTHSAAYTLVTCKNDASLTAQEALDSIVAGRDFPNDNELYTDSGDSRTSFEWEDTNEIEVLLGRERGFATRWGLEVLRDGDAMYFLHRAGRNRGVRIEHGRNLVGATLEFDATNVVTAIKPRGIKKDGSLLYLTDDPKSPENYILSEHAGDYPMLRCAVLDCEDCTVDKKQVTVQLARERMREQVARKYNDDKVDRPSATLRVNFIELGQTQEYAHYADLEIVNLYDEVPVVATEYGIELMTKVHEIDWDPVNERVIEVVLGDLRADVASIYSWQVQPFPGGKVLPGTLPGSALEDGAISMREIDSDIRLALEKAWADIESAQTLIDDTRQWLDTVEGAVKDSEGNIAALEVEASYIRAGLMNAEEDLLAVMLRADLMQIALTNVEGDISTLKLTADEAAITISDMEQSISSIRQTANSVSITVSGPGGLATQIQQLSDRVAIKLHNPGVHSTFEAIVGGPDMGPADIGVSFRFVDSPYDPYGVVGVHRASGDVQGGVVLYGYPTVDISGRTEVLLSAGGNNPEEITLNWADHKIYATRALTVQSDARLKTDVEDIDHGEALFDAIMPRQYRMIADGPDGCLQYGFLAQDVKAVQEALGLPKTALLSVPADPEKMMGLNYQEYIALTAHKVKCMEAHYQARIDTLEARLVALENKEVSPC